MVYDLFFNYKDESIKVIVEGVDHIPRIGEMVEISWEDGSSDSSEVVKVKSSIPDMRLGKTVVSSRRPPEVHLKDISGPQRERQFS